MESNALLKSIKMKIESKLQFLPSSRMRRRVRIWLNVERPALKPFWLFLSSRSTLGTYANHIFFCSNQVGGLYGTNEKLIKRKGVKLPKKGVKSLMWRNFKYETYANLIYSCSPQEVGWLYGTDNRSIRCEKSCEVINFEESYNLCNYSWFFLIIINSIHSMVGPFISHLFNL